MGAQHRNLSKHLKWPARAHRHGDLAASESPAPAHGPAPAPVTGRTHPDRESPGLARRHSRDGGSLHHRLPGLQAVSSYQRRWLARDVTAGVVLTTLLVPQGMAYAELAGLPPITGLYTSIVCLLSYAVFGPSRILVLGPAPMAGSAARGRRESTSRHP